ncbi:HlyD family efflux transporter periplasmic adaptor subunit [Neomegalonema sp.]|uniref:efflux RND transporter periplasmic adaptor subunit n=1 Tax=Neomegalonema sp. TaxID=2039713 RepID=UPI00260F2486|nr:HlyD family efflux transporter periplasmic adaptor subunit [Neomegalonema sp.]MDD2867966.1 HlyD family efflux transporter periplasmic adaptor subunit [Neomegalonema sp.]
MRFLARALRGSAILLACFALLAYGGWRMVEAQRIAAQRPAPRPAPERSFTAPIEAFAPDSSALTTTVFGQIEAPRSLELRAGAAGRIVALGAGGGGDFRDGALVREGEILARIDPAATDTRSADARAALADAQARLATTSGNQGLRQAELDSALQQQAIREDALSRQQQLASRGFAARTAVETAQIAANSARQEVETRRQSLASLQNEIRQAQLAVERARLTLSDAERAGAETVLRAPFSGVLNAVSAAAVTGRMVSASETLGTLVDLGVLEVRFQVSGSEYARLTDGAGKLKPLTARVSLTMSDGVQSLPARLTRIGAAVAQGQGGRTLYAALDEGGGLRPGDFVRIEIAEPALDALARVPASALTEDGRVLVFNRQAGRLEEMTLEIRRRSGDWVYVAGAPIGSEYVTQRTRQLGPGVRFRDPATPEAPAAGPGGFGAGFGGQRGQGAAGAPQGQRPQGEHPQGERPQGAPGEGRPQRPEGGWSGERPQGGAPGEGRPPRGEGGPRPEGRPSAPPSASALEAPRTGDAS